MVLLATPCALRNHPRHFNILKVQTALHKELGRKLDRSGDLSSRGSTAGQSGGSDLHAEGEVKQVLVEGAELVIPLLQQSLQLLALLLHLPVL